MTRLPRITAAELLRVLRREGWREARQKGSHIHLTNPDRPGRVTVPVHSGEIIKPKVLLSILEQAGLTADDLRRLL